MNICEVSDMLAVKICKNSVDYKNDVDIISYGIQGLLSTIINFCFGLIIAFYLNLILEFILFNITFVPIRINHKGYHCKTFINCIFCSNLMLIFATKFISLIELELVHSFIVFLVILILHFLISCEKNTLLHIVIFIIYLLSLNIQMKVDIAFIVAIFTNTILIIWRKYNEQN